MLKRQERPVHDAKAERPSILTLHRSADRHAFYRQNLKSQPFFDAEADCWVVTDPDLCREVLASATMKPATYIEGYAAMQARFGIDFSTVLFVLGHIPLANSGEEHANLRRRMAKFLAGRYGAIRAWMADDFIRHMEVFDRLGRVELMSAFVRPVVRELMELTIGVPLPAELSLDNASVVFDKSLGIARRRRIEADLSALKALIVAHLGADADPEDIGIRLSLLILGNDALIGTIGLSLHRLFLDLDGKRLDAAPLPQTPMQTGVPFIERIAVEDITFGAMTVAQGQRVRTLLQSIEYAEGPVNSARFFGAGAHACLGRPLSLDIWAALTERLARTPRSIGEMTHSLTTDNYLFASPAILEVEIH